MVTKVSLVHVHEAGVDLMLHVCILQVECRNGLGSMLGSRTRRKKVQHMILVTFSLDATKGQRLFKKNPEEGLERPINFYLLTKRF